MLSDFSSINVLSESNSYFLEYRTNSEDSASGDQTFHQIKDSSSQFYKEHSAADLGDLRERQQLWIKQKFNKRGEDNCQLFMEKNFDHFFKDFSINPDTKTLDSKDIGTLSSVDEEQKEDFSREDLGQISDSVSLDYSVFTDKGSVSQPKDDGNEQLIDVNEKTHSPFWKRIDMRQKKVIRGLCGLTKDHFKSMIPVSKSKNEMFKVWDEYLSTRFLELYRDLRLQLLGHISVMCLSWKFSDKVNSCEFFTEEEKIQIIKFGTEFREQRNGCSSSKTRKSMLNSPIVKIGKLLYSSSPEMEKSFWSQINERKKADIVDVRQFKDAHIKDINKIPIIGVCGDL